MELHLIFIALLVDIAINALSLRHAQQPTPPHGPVR